MFSPPEEMSQWDISSGRLPMGRPLHVVLTFMVAERAFRPRSDREQTPHNDDERTRAARVPNWAPGRTTAQEWQGQIESLNQRYRDLYRTVQSHSQSISVLQQGSQNVQPSVINRIEQIKGNMDQRFTDPGIHVERKIANVSHEIERQPNELRIYVQYTPNVPCKLSESTATTADR